MSLTPTSLAKDIEEILKDHDNTEEAAKKIEEQFSQYQLGVNLPIHNTIKEIMEGTNK